MKVSIVLTTYGDHLDNARSCLGAISGWKKDCELVVACHDAGPALADYLSHEKLIDKLIWTPDGFGHLRGVNLAVLAASEPFVFNVTHSMIVGDGVLAACAETLKEENTGLVGWHWRGRGIRWKGDGLQYTMREPRMREELLTPTLRLGRVLHALGGPVWMWCCNTSFCGFRKSVWEEVGGFNTSDFVHGLADDYLTYAVVNTGRNSVNIPERFYRPECFLSRRYKLWHRHGLERVRSEAPPCLVKHL
jgi:hypothetical protein